MGKQLLKKDNDKTKIINRLILVGNGFDLSLGLKTSYKDFLCWYFKRFIITSLNNKSQRIERNASTKYLFNEDELFIFYNRTNYNYTTKHIKEFEDSHISFDQVKRFILKSPQVFNYEFKSVLLKRIFYDSITGWVDIEKTYFDLLRECIKQKSEVDTLNEHLKVIKSLLIEYLNQVDYSVTLNNDVANEYNLQFGAKVMWEDILDPLELDGYDNLEVGHTFFLNFNYTRSLSNIAEKLPNAFLRARRRWVISISQIHGVLFNDLDTIVFGYGDEMDKDYKTLEELNDNRFLKNIKSFEYAKNGNYRELLKFLNSNDYQVVIYGHSCGLSDRVLLNEIFEHENCKSIKVYYYNKEEFINKTMDISRHFNSNQLMRKRITYFREEDKIPQFNS